MCVPHRRTIGLPLSQVLCSANGVGQRGPITPSHTQTGSTDLRGESSDGGGNASFHDLRCSRHSAHWVPGSPQTPAQAPRAPEDQGHSPERPRTGANDTRCLRICLPLLRKLQELAASMARELQWSASGRTAHGARDDTSGGCEAFKDARDDVRYGHGGRYGHAASCQALNPEAPFRRHRVRGVRLQRRPQAVRDPRRGGSKDPDVLAIPADRNTKCSRPC
jgi:hypothetical protein